MCEWGRKVKKTGVIDSESLEHSVKGYGQMTWANVSQWCVHLSILVTSRTDGVEIALQDQSEESAASSTRLGRSCMSNPAVIYILSNVSGHCPTTWTKGVKSSMQRQI